MTYPQLGMVRDAMEADNPRGEFAEAVEVASIRQDFVDPRPHEVRSPSTALHYPKAREIIILQSGVDIIERSLGFDCRAIAIQNLGSNQFVYCPQFNEYLSSKRTPQAVYNLPSATEKLSLVWHTNLFYAVSPAAIAGEYAILWLYDEWIPPIIVEDSDGIVVVGGVTQNQVAQNAASVVLRSANQRRADMIIHNNSAATLYISFNGAASVNNYLTAIPPGGTWSMSPGPVYRDNTCFGIWTAAGAGFANIADITQW